MSNENNTNQNTKPSHVLGILFPVVGQPRLQAFENTLENWQQQVGGLIDCCETEVAGVMAVFNDEGVLMSLPWNLKMISFSVVEEPVAGNFLLLGDQNTPEGREFIDLTWEQIKAIETVYGSPISGEYERLSSAGGGA